MKTKQFYRLPGREIQKYKIDEEISVDFGWFMKDASKIDTTRENRMMC